MQISFFRASKNQKSLPFPTTHSYPQNKRQPSIDDLYKIAEILNVDIKELLVSNKPEQDTK